MYFIVAIIYEPSRELTTSIWKHMPRFCAENPNPNSEQMNTLAFSFLLKIFMTTISLFFINYVHMNVGD